MRERVSVCAGVGESERERERESRERIHRRRTEKDIHTHTHTQRERERERERRRRKSEIAHVQRSGKPGSLVMSCGLLLVVKRRHAKRKGRERDGRATETLRERDVRPEVIEYQLGYGCPVVDGPRQRQHALGPYLIA